MQRQHSSPQLFSSTRNTANSDQQKAAWEFAKSQHPAVSANTTANTTATSNGSQVDPKQNGLPFTPRGPPPPKPPRITNSLKKAAAAQAAQAALEAQIRANEQR